MKNNQITIIEAKKDLFNGGKCFTKGNRYTVKKSVYNEASLIDAETINDQGERHLIGSWWREFEIIREDETE